MCVAVADEQPATVSRWLHFAGGTCRARACSSSTPTGENQRGKWEFFSPSLPPCTSHEVGDDDIASAVGRVHPSRLHNDTTFVPAGCGRLGRGGGGGGGGAGKGWAEVLKGSGDEKRTELGKRQPLL